MSPQDYNNGMGMPENAGEQLEEIPPKPHQAFLFLMLFVRPSLALPMASLHRMWCMAFFMTALILAVSTFYEAIDLYKKYTPVVMEVESAVSPDVTPIALKDGVISWRHETGEKYSKAVAGWQVDFMENLDETLLRNSIQRHGVCITPEKVYLWMRDVPEKGRFRFDTIINQKQLKSLEERGGAVEYDAKEFHLLMKMLCVMFLPVLAVGVFLKYAWSIVLCELIFIVSTRLFRRGKSPFNFLELVVLAINMSLVPTLVSVIWHGALHQAWSFDSIYFIAFIAYMLYAFYDSRKNMPAESDTQQDKNG